ncbi:hypothetical protein PIB30_068252 [Stylosanthes scabra]|uniref:Uncharacterized protein n=1 Tax=Stylosanthes scabra TaxID=79078 RepID=A0ABU6UMT4_9FABA|nr:hypothetical protein [Stylosanthes scabra]
MARKTHVQKEKKKHNGKKYDKTHKMRCTPHDVAQLLAKLSNAQMRIMREMDFSALENLSVFNVNIKVMMEIVESFHVQDSTIRTNLGKVTINAAKIGHALGLNARGHRYEQKLYNKKLSKGKKAIQSFKGALLFSLKNMVEEIESNSEENIKKFKRAFILYTQKSILCPNSSTPIFPKHFPAIVDVENPRARNWARHIYSFLLDGIKC